MNPILEKVNPKNKEKFDEKSSSSTSKWYKFIERLF